MIIDEINIKIVVLGLGGVGKTSTIQSFLGKDLPESYMPTIGSNIFRREYILNEKKIRIRLNIWDVGGQRSFNPFNATVYTDMDIALLVFDLSKPKESLDEIKELHLTNLIEYAEKSIPFIVGNKLDLIEDKEDLKKITEKTEIENLPLLFTSAHTSENVIETFDLIVYKFLKEWEKNITEEKFKDIADVFLAYIDKDEKELEKILINVKNIDSLMPKKRKITNVSEKEV